MPLAAGVLHASLLLCWCASRRLCLLAKRQPAAHHLHPPRHHHVNAPAQSHVRRGALDVHEWRGSFRGVDAAFKMTSVIGHVYSLDFTAAFNSWDRVDPAELFDAPTVKSEANPKV